MSPYENNNILTQLLYPDWQEEPYYYELSLIAYDLGCWHTT